MVVNTNNNNRRRSSTSNTTKATIVLAPNTNNRSHSWSSGSSSSKSRSRSKSTTSDSIDNNGAQEQPTTADNSQDIPAPAATILTITTAQLPDFSSASSGNDYYCNGVSTTNSTNGTGVSQLHPCCSTIHRPQKADLEKYFYLQYTREKAPRPNSRSPSGAQSW